VPCIELAGFAAAQAVCCLFDRQPMVPLAFSRGSAHGVRIGVMPGGSPAEISASGTRWLDANPDGAAEAVVVYDAYITMAGTKKDALLLECRSYEPPMARAKIAVPYRPHHHPGGFAIYRPKFIVDAIEGHDLESLTKAFVNGVCSHGNGARIWDACSDQSW
jgi:hypothetical protein